MSSLNANAAIPEMLRTEPNDLAFTRGGFERRSTNECRVKQLGQANGLARFIVVAARLFG